MTWCNAWSTQRRFQNDAGKCLLDPECRGEDSIEHYSICERQIAVIDQKCRLVTPRSCPSWFFCFSSDSIDETVFRACHCYATKRAVDNIRHSPAASECVNIERLLWNGHRVAQLSHSSLMRRYGRINYSTIEWEDI
eukprot:gnl/MRDRNA2_/MRDRNA2_58918_c0_seq1.p1 gnl/MRDRNA2_/MRDRNA2_58918_c0~~gnl/MRDRNA2_/MRDRNA2_58918_c0_seq1.p1  ORF type:complete len:137 (-),score=3.50 gnl/MRDRNA2_/MRDRNA2_58918_c0_seq1:362-772(-)